VFDLVFRRALELELFEVAAAVVFALVCCFGTIWSELVGGLVGQYEDEELRAKIVEGFRMLTPDNLAKFNEFCVRTYGLLFVR